MKQRSTLTRLGHALKTLHKKPDRVTHPNRRNLSAVRTSHQYKPSRNQQYSEHYRAESVNRIKAAIVNSDGSYIAIDVYSHSSIHARRMYRKTERR